MGPERLLLPKNFTFVSFFRFILKDDIPCIAASPPLATTVHCNDMLTHPYTYNVIIWADPRLAIIHKTYGHSVPALFLRSVICVPCNTRLMHHLTFSRSDLVVVYYVVRALARPSPATTSKTKTLRSLTSKTKMNKFSML